MQIRESVVVVTGANRGIGAEFVRQLRERGAARVVAGARDASTVAGVGTDPVTGTVVEAVSLDVTDHEAVQRVADAAGDVTIVVNNAGISSAIPLVTGDLAAIRREFETNVFGPLAVTRAFADTLARNGGGAVLNVLSASSWSSFPGATTYGATKAGAWGLTDGLRLELATQGTQVTGLHMGLVDTDMTAGFDGEKITVGDVVTAALDGLERGDLEVLADEPARQVKASLALDPADRYAGMLPARV
jgi:short-subunit dehydrogenase